MIIVDNTTKAYGTRTRRTKAVDQVSFQVPPGTVFGLLGPNGAGKTTLLRMVAGLVGQDEGTITVGGLDNLRDQNKLRSRLSFLTGDMRITGQLTPLEWLDYWGRLHGMTRAQRAVSSDSLVETFDLKDFAHRAVDQLSLGNRQRTLLAMSLVHGPQVLVLDEPSNGLDIGASRALSRYLVTARDSGKTIILSTHIFTEIEKVCDRIGILDRGRLIESGTFEEITTRTKTSSLEDAFFELTRRSS